MSVLAHAHGLVDANRVDSNHPRLLPLPRRVVDELVLLAVLAPLAVADLGASFMDEIYSTDASEFKGASTVAECTTALSELLWRSGRCKGAYTRLKTPHEAMLQRLGLREEGADDDEAGPLLRSSAVGRPLVFKYDFIEVYAGASKVSAAASELGLVVGPYAFSSEYDMASAPVIGWLSHIMSTGLLSSAMVEPVCTTFSMIRRPPLRSQSKPVGFNPLEKHTRLGNILALSAFTDCLQTWTSMMRFLPQWSAISRRSGSMLVSYR